MGRPSVNQTMLYRYHALFPWPGPRRDSRQSILSVALPLQSVVNIPGTPSYRPSSPSNIDDLRVTYRIRIAARLGSWPLLGNMRSGHRSSVNLSRPRAQDMGGWRSRVIACLGEASEVQVYIWMVACVRFFLRASKQSLALLLWVFVQERELW
jgi:hypothetical protein